MRRVSCADLAVPKPRPYVRVSRQWALEYVTHMFNRAIVRKLATNFADGLTCSSLGTPDFAKAVQQHQSYCEALAECGLKLQVLGEDCAHPDSTFVEDVAVLTRNTAILARPGAVSREGEVGNIREPLALFFSSFAEIKPPGTLDGGDVCEAGKHFFIGVSQRTNESGAQQLSEIVKGEGYRASFVDIRAMQNILHLKSGIAYLGDNYLVAWEEMATRKEFAGYDLIPVTQQESYAANCIRVNDRILIPAGYPLLQLRLEQRGFSVIPLGMSEFHKMDGGLSCLSLRF